jgi:hypothetical protein
LPFADMPIDILAGIFFIVFYFFNDVDVLFSPKRFLVSIITGIVELVEFADWLPMWILGVIAIHIFVRAEDTTGITLPVPNAKTLARGTIKGGRSKIRKNLRRATQSKEFRSKAQERLEKIRKIRSDRERSGGSVSLKSPSSPHEQKAA